MQYLKNATVFIFSIVIVFILSINISLADDKLHSTLSTQAPNLDSKILAQGLAAYECARDKGLVKYQYLTLIDFTQPSNKKRLWIFDLKNKKLVFNTLVAHGIKTGDLYAKYFSDMPNEHKSSLGLYTTDNTYIGKHGLSLRIRGTEAGFNEKAFNRNVVVHGAWYVNPDFVQKYGRIGRSWGCPAVPQDLSSSIVNTIKNGSIILVYSNDKVWLSNSKFINCK